MYRKLRTRKLNRSMMLALSPLCISLTSLAQISLSGQLRPRAEIRDGLANLGAGGSVPASFVSQRTRLLFGYNWERLKFAATIQDVRVWGQDASSISNADGSKLMLHEGWAEIILANKTDTTIRFKLLDNFSLKIGRQELIYDDARLIGNLDWLQQGRRFDMILLKSVHHGWQMDFGYAYNQNTDAFNISGTNYVPGNIPQYIKNDIGVLVPTPVGMVPLTSANGNSSATGSPTYLNPPNTNSATQDYKNFESIYISKTHTNTKISILGFRDAFSRYTISSVATGGGNVYGRIFNINSTNDRYTFGGMISPTIQNLSGYGKLSMQAAYYHQLGKDREGKDLNAYHYTIAASYGIKKISFSPGVDVLSGNSVSTAANQSKRFDPLYGTPHKFWGYMDYFYAGTGSPAAGLLNYYVKTKFKSGGYIFSADYHHFSVDNAMAATDQKDLGDEIDLSANYTANKFTTVELGYSQMFAARDAMKAAKGQTVPNVEKFGRWGYLMLKITPDFIYTRQAAIAP